MDSRSGTGSTLIVFTSPNCGDREHKIEKREKVEEGQKLKKMFFYLFYFILMNHIG